MSSTTKAENGSSFFPVLAILVMVVATAFIIAPSFDEVRLRDHAVQRHGSDAVIARANVKSCPDSFAYECPPTKDHPLTYHIICKHGNLCSVMIVTRRGVELTSFILPCSRLTKRVSHCEEAIVP